MRLLLICVVAFQSGVAPRPTAPTQPGSRTVQPPAAGVSQRGSDTLPVVVRLQNTGKSAAESAREAADKRDADNGRAWTLVLAVVAVLVSAGSAVAALRTFFLMRTTAN